MFKMKEKRNKATRNLFKYKWIILELIFSLVTLDIHRFVSAPIKIFSHTLSRPLSVSFTKIVFLSVCLSFSIYTCTSQSISFLCILFFTIDQSFFMFSLSYSSLLSRYFSLSKMSFIFPSSLSELYHF